jgi:hypothetical protein
VNREWAENKVREFIALLEQSAALWEAGLRSMPTSNWDQVEASIGHRILTIDRIAREVNVGLCEGLVTRDGGMGFPHTTQRRSSEMLLGALVDMDELEANLGPQGPRLAAAQLHPWVWEAAARQWDDGHRRDAIQRSLYQCVRPGAAL